MSWKEAAGESGRGKGRLEFEEEFRELLGPQSLLRAPDGFREAVLLALRTERTRNRGFAPFLSKHIPQLLVLLAAGAGLGWLLNRFAPAGWNLPGLVEVFEDPVAQLQTRVADLLAGSLLPGNAHAAQAAEILVSFLPLLLVLPALVHFCISTARES